MKTIKIQQIIAVLLCLLAVNTQAGNGDSVKIFRGQLYASGTYFATPMADAKWNNANTATSTKASYSNFNGETFVSLIAYDKQTEIVLESRVKVSKGQLCIIVENSNGEVLFEKTFKKDETITAALTLDVYEQYKIRFIGEETKGSYACHWTQK